MFGYRAAGVNVPGINCPGHRLGRLDGESAIGEDSSVQKPMMMIKARLVCLLLAVLLPTMATAVNGESLPVVIDQFGKPVSLSDAEPGVRVAILVSAKRLRRLQKWETALRKRFPELAILRVADVPRDAPTRYEDVAEAFRKRLPEEVGVGIDLAGDWAGQLNVDPSVPNILIFASSGDLEAVHSGMFSNALFAQAAADIDLLIKAENRANAGA
jgi:hypothetical protein